MENKRFYLPDGSPIGDKPQKTSKFITSVYAFTGILIIYGILNLFGYGFQELVHKGDTDKLASIKQYLDTEKAPLQELGTSLRQKQDELGNKNNQLVNLKSQGNTSKYNSKVDEYNDSLSEYKSDLNKYENELKTYNQKVQEYNDLANSSGTRYYAIPLPR